MTTEREQAEDGARRGGMSNGQCSKGWGGRCAAAKGGRCRCACGGANHGAQYRLALGERVQALAQELAEKQQAFDEDVDLAIEDAKRRGWLEEVPMFRTIQTKGSEGLDGLIPCEGKYHVWPVAGETDDPAPTARCRCGALTYADAPSAPTEVAL